MRLRPPVTYPIIGLALSFGSPAGALLIRMITVGAVREDPLRDLGTHTFFYLYQWIATSLVFTLAGVVAGRQADRLRKAEKFYHRLSDHDSLTGLHNARALTDRCRRAVERALRSEEPLSMMLIDVDHLKALNDASGHATGNRALAHVADALVTSKRTDDTAARWGGDEFAILLEGADAAVAMRVGEAVLAHLRTTPLRVARKLVIVTVTIGICTATKPATADALLAAADRPSTREKNEDGIGSQRPLSRRER